MRNWLRAQEFTSGIYQDKMLDFWRSFLQWCPCRWPGNRTGSKHFPHAVVTTAFPADICWGIWWTIQRRQWHLTPVLFPGKSHGRRSLVGCSPWGHWESGTTEQLHFHFSLSCIGEGNGNPLQCSCLENPRDGGAWWAAVYGVAQSRTRLKQLSSSSSKIKRIPEKHYFCFIDYAKTLDCVDHNKL